MAGSADEDPDTIRVKRAQRTRLSSQPMISGFTPISTAGINAAPDLLGLAQTPVGGRKRSASQLESPLSTSKKPKKAVKPKQPKHELGSRNQDITRGLPRTKTAPKEDGALLHKPVPNHPNDGTIRQEQAPTTSAELSTETLHKLDSFRYRRGTNEGLQKPYQAEPLHAQVIADLRQPQRSAHEEFQARSTSHYRSIDENHGIDNILGESRIEPAMRPTSAGPTLAIDTTLIAKDGSIGAPMTPERQAAEELLHAATEFHRASADLGQAHGQSGNFEGCERSLKLPMYASPSLPYIPRISSPDVQATELPSCVVWNDMEEDKELLAMFANHNDLKRTPEKEDRTVHRIPCCGISPATRVSSLPYSEIPVAPKVGVVDRQGTGAAEDEFPVEDEELSDMMQILAGQDQSVPVSSFQCPSDSLSQRSKLYDTTPTHDGAGSGKTLPSSYREDEYIPTSAQIIVDANSSPPNHRPRSHQTDLYARGHLGSANDIQMNSDQRSDDLEFLDQYAESYFLDTAVAFSDDDYGLSSPPACSPPPKLPSNTSLAPVPDSVSTHLSPVTPSMCEVQPSPVAIPNLAGPLSSQENILTPPYVIKLTADGSPKPFVRPKVPNPIRDRSPILGLNTRLLHRTCFRIGEALNAASAASRASNDVLIELYARVIYSTREAGHWKQQFEFADLFTSDKPPFLSGTYDLWKGVPLWEHDSRAFLGEDGKGRLARVVGKISRDVESKAWKMRILNVWAAELEDVAWVKGIVCA
ncbi:hypothetical protein LPUS_06706 [Lasallia pustulata]|uniref:Uncharacterized protein n=1 Tax=Lasallia pustulata TaxID=136370 RepID=A0A1W5D1T0_9LECA|nr:hypothetical protein LPUS_06706 [Lasallia pustulata]